MGVAMVDLKGFRVLCPGGTPARAWVIESELDGTIETETPSTTQMATLTADSADADDFATAATNIFGDWYSLQADLEPVADTWEERHTAFGNRLRSMFSDFRNLW